MALVARPWAAWRQVQYGFLLCTVLALLFWLFYFVYFYQPANCFDGAQNSLEAGVDCGGSCVRICAFDVIPPRVLWVESFQVVGDQYNALAYIENPNQLAATSELNYTFVLYERGEIITERSGTTVLPPDSEYPIFEARINTNGRVPDDTELILHEPEVWQPASIGRGQFQVKERVLHDSDTRPRLEATIENQELIEAKRTEVVATIFDARGNPLTASRTFIDDFAPRSEEDITFTWPQPIAKTLRSCEVPTDVAVVIDLSGSMNNDGDNPPEPVTSVLEAAEAFAGRLQSGDQAALVTFATEAVLQNPLTTELSLITSRINDLTINPEDETGSTNTGEAITIAREELTSLRHNGAARKVMVLLTDGLATAPDPDPESFALEAAFDIKRDGVIVYTIGLGEEVNMDFVRSVASSPDQAFQAVNRAQIDQIYQTITEEICEDGPAVIDIVPKTTASFQPLR